MKIGFFTNTYFPICYGSVVSIESFRKNLEKLGHEVFVFAPYHNGYKDESKKIFRYPAFLFRYKIDYPISIPMSSFINKKIKELDLDIIHVHQPFSLGKEGLRFARKLNIPVVFTYHAKYEDYVHYVPLFPENLLSELVKKEAVNFANKCDLTITPSHGIRKIIQKRGVSKDLIQVLPTGIDWKSFQKDGRDWLRKKYKIKSDEILCLNIGRINEEKNLYLLFDSIKEVILKNPKVKMMFIGEGFIRERLIKKSKKAGLEKNFIFPGFIKYDEVKKHFHGADIYLQTSVSETQGMTILEAMASGLPVVAVKGTGTEDFIKSEVNGILTKNNQKDFVEKLSLMIKDRKKAKKISLQAKKDSREYEESKQTQKLEKIYKKLIRE